MFKEGSALKGSQIYQVVLYIASLRMARPNNQIAIYDKPQLCHSAHAGIDIDIRTSRKRYPAKSWISLAGLTWSSSASSLCSSSSSTSSTGGASSSGGRRLGTHFGDFLFLTGFFLVCPHHPFHFHFTPQTFKFVPRHPGEVVG